MERQYTRLDEARTLIDGIIKSIPDERMKRGAYVHLYGVGLLAALLALKRGCSRETAELAEIAGMLHDLLTYVDPAEDTEDHAHKCAGFAKTEVLDRLQSLSEEEKALIYRGVYRHSDKHVRDGDFDELVKDADVLHHGLRNPAEEYFFAKERFQQLLQELM